MHWNIRSDFAGEIDLLIGYWVDWRQILKGYAFSNLAAVKTKTFNSSIGLTRNWFEGRAVAAALTLFFAVWALYGSITTADKSLHHDVLEAYAWGKEFKLGYNQHPPFWAWIAGAWFELFPTTNASFILLAVLNSTLGLLGAWRLIGLFAQGQERIAATLLLLATPFYTFLSFKYNANIIFLSLWPWTLYFFVKSLDGMRLRDALAFGMFAALSILSKYFAITLLLTCLVSLPFHKSGWKYITSPLPYAAAGVFALLVLPHLIWAISAGAPPVAYAMGLTGKGWLFSIRNCASFLAGVALYHGVILLIALLSRYAPKAETHPAVAPEASLRRGFLAALVFAPPLITVIFGLSLQLEVSPNMTLGCFPLMPLFLMRLAGPLNEARCLRYAAWSAIAVSAGALFAAPIVTMVLAHRSKDPVLLEPRKELAAKVTELWRAETHTPLRYAGAPTRYANAMSFYSSDHPSSLIDLNYAKARWVTPEKLQQSGLVMACPEKDVFCLAKVEKFLSGSWKQTSITLSSPVGTLRSRDETFAVYIVPPHQP